MSKNLQFVVQILFSIIFLVLIHMDVLAQRQVIDKVVATVGSELILLSEVEEQYALLASRQQGGLQDDARCIIMDQILASKLLVNQAKLDSIEVSDEEVEQQLNARFEQILQYMNGDIKQFEQYYGQTIPQVKEAFREDLRNQILAERIRGQILNEVSVTPKEVKEFFDKIPRDSLPYFNSEVEVSEIVVKPIINPISRRNAEDQLKEIRSRIVNNGESFADLASKNSHDFGSARIGGDLGWAKRGKFVPEFEAAAYNLDINEISEVFESPFGFHIIQLLERRGNSIHTRHILIRPEMTESDLQLAQNKLDSVRQLILDDSLTFSQALKKFGNEDVQSFSNNGRIINQTTGDTFFEIGDLDPDVYFAIDTMGLRGITSAFKYTDPSGDPYYRIILMQSQTEPHVANLDQDYDKIKKATIQSKQSNFITLWVNEKVADTYINVSEEYNSCQNLNKWFGKPQVITP